MAFAKKDEGVAVIKPANIVRTTLRVRGTAAHGRTAGCPAHRR